MPRSHSPAPTLVSAACLALATVTCASLVACGRGEKVDAKVEAEKVWNERCVTCHGPQGKGDGPSAPALIVKPRSFADPNWQASVDNARIGQVIVKGGASVGLSDAMAPNPDLADKPEVVDELVRRVRRMVQ